MNETQKLHLVSDELFSTKFTQLIEVLSNASPSSAACLRLIEDPTNPGSHIIVQGETNVTNIIRDIVLLEIPEIGELTQLENQVAEMSKEIADLKSALATCVTESQLQEEVNEAVNEAVEDSKTWEPF